MRTAATGFARALREWREHRRMSQLELAFEAGTTQRHVSFLENGRSVPGRGMVVRLAESLEVPLRDRNELLLAAGYAPAYSESDLDDPALATIREALNRILAGHLPYPAVVVDRGADLVSGNTAFWALVEGIEPELLEPPVNVARVLMHPGGLAPRILNQNEWGWHVVRAVRREARREPSKRLEALVAELDQLVSGPPPDPGPDYLGFAVPLRLRHGDCVLELITTLARFGTAVDVAVAELRLEAFLPGNAETAVALAELAASAEHV